LQTKCKIAIASCNILGKLGDEGEEERLNRVIILGQKFGLIGHKSGEIMACDTIVSNDIKMIPFWKADTSIMTPLLFNQLVIPAHFPFLLLNRFKKHRIYTLKSLAVTLMIYGTSHLVHFSTFSNSYNQGYLIRFKDSKTNTKPMHFGHYMKNYYVQKELVDEKDLYCPTPFSFTKSMQIQSRLFSCFDF
jgi:hypothetical protein